MNRLIRYWQTEHLLASGLGRSAAGGAGRGTSALLALSRLGVTLSLLVMLITVSVSLGFKRGISTFAYGQTGHISLYPAGSNWLGTQTTLSLSPRLGEALEGVPEVAALYGWVQQRAMLKTKTDYAGVQLLGLDSGVRHPYFAERMQVGAYPSFSSLDTVRNPIVLSSRLAERMRCGVGDKVQMYFLGEEVRVRSFRVSGIYDASGLEQMPALCGARALRQIDRLPEDAYHRLALELSDGAGAEEVMPRLTARLEADPALLGGQVLQMARAEELLPELFSWLDLLDSNVYVLLGLMLLVSGFTMISGLLILVLDKTQHIGVLKALGAADGLLRRVFVLLSMRLALGALLWGNALFALLYLVQTRWHILRLDPDSYHMDFVPMYLPPAVWLGINGATLLVVLLALVLPSRISAKVSPAEAMRFD